MKESTIDAIAGAIAGIFTNIFTHPLDTIKCRMQTEPSFYTNIFKTSLHIYKYEKFFGFYKGIFANTLINVPVSSFMFLIYGKCKRNLKKKKIMNNNYLIYFVSGCTAGLYLFFLKDIYFNFVRSTIFLVVPLELIKCNQQVNFQGKTKKENRFFKKAQHIFRKQGLLGFSRGFFVTVNRDVFSTGLYFSIYYSIKDYFKKKSLEFDSLHKGVAGAFSGSVVWAITYPFDTVKTIIQTASFKTKKPKQLDVFKELYKKGGISELYRGAMPSLMYSVSSSALMFIFFEVSKNLIFLTKTTINL